MRRFLNENGELFDSFLTAVESGNYSIKDVNISAIYNFLVYGALYFEDTFIEGIQKKFSHQNNIIDSKLGFVPEKAQDFTLFEEAIVKNPERLFIDFFEKRKHFFDGKKISVDLTGGIDSRLIATILNYLEVPFDSFYSLEVGSAKESEIVKSVAKELKVDLKLFNNLDNKNSIDFLFEKGDGLWDVFAIESLVNSQSWRKEQKYDLVVTGVGGELYKDFWWLQDFPFYNKSKANLEKLINFRMYPMKGMSKWWSEEKVRAEDYENDFRLRLKKYISDTNSRTYDHIYYNIRIKEMVSVLSKVTSSYLDTYSPLLESDLLKIGYNLKRKERFFNSFHRRLISRLNTKVSKLSTTEGGVSASIDIKYLAKDYIYYTNDKLNKAFEKMASKRRGKPFIDKKINENSMQIEACLEVIKSSGIFSQNAPSKYSEVPSALSGRVLTVGMFLKKLQN